LRTAAQTGLRPVAKPSASSERHHRSADHRLRTVGAFEPHFTPRQISEGLNLDRDYHSPRGDVVSLENSVPSTTAPPVTVPTTTVPSTSLPATTVPDTSATVPASQTYPYAVTGVGTTVVEWTGCQLVLVSAIPAAGWILDEAGPDIDGVESTYTQGELETRIDFEIEDGQVRIRTRDDDTDERTERFEYFPLP